MDWFNKQREYFESLPCDKDCTQLFTDITNCVNHDIQYKKNYLEITNNKPNCFDFTKCKEFGKLYQLEKVKTIKYNIKEIKSAYTHSYEVKYNQGALEIYLDWRKI